MIRIYYSPKGTPIVKASDLHKELNIQESLSEWFPKMIAFGFVNKQDYFKLTKGIEEGEDEWSVHIEMAKTIAFLQKSKLGQELREYLLFLERQKSEGELLTRQQIEALMDIADVLGLFSVQTFLQNEHCTKFLVNSKPKAWWEYRARLFGYSADQIKEMIEKYGIKYESQRQSLFHLDRHELIRVACVDLFKLLGKSDEYALNMGSTAELFAKKLKTQIYDDRKMSLSFTSQQQNKTINSIKNYKNNPALLDSF